MGTAEEAFNDYSVVFNLMKGIEEETLGNTQMNLLYTMHGDELSDNSSMNARVHRSVIMPVLKELRGYLRVYIWDCSHPKIAKGEVEFGQKHVCDVAKNP